MSAATESPAWIARARALRAAHGRHLPGPRPAPGRMVRPRAGAGRGHRADQHVAGPDRPGARAAHARRRGWRASGRDEDQLAFRRDERDFLNPTLVELPNAASGKRPGDFAVAVLRNLLVAALAEACCGRRWPVTDAELAAIAAKALKEAATTCSMPATGWCAWATAPTSRTPHGRRAGRLALHPPTVRGRCGRRQAPPPAWARVAARCAQPGMPRWTRCWQAGLAVPAPRPSAPPAAGPAQRAPGLHAGRDAAPAAQLPRGRW